MALRFLAVREHARLELARKLAQRGFEQSVIAQTLDWLMAEGALDESRLAAQYVAERAEKGFGPLKIRAELQAKGIADELIEYHLRSMDDSWPRIIARTYAHRFGDTAPKERADYARRARFLAQRGFTSESIRRLLPYHPD
ncbi:regulatory protein RecX [Caldichromatium japonicum]|uniref:Regulatory protein RecX n=1 Tax=Caldichromatium japonicum TaxID=2699430 RepID=A0A6G7VCG5_9GAMM|nr:regulatory protein RecX [Caldichromatium japonicum]QIK37749.1 regulatory protein RecX [Caldichromatium japonicum]